MLPYDLFVDKVLDLQANIESGKVAYPPGRRLLLHTADRPNLKLRSLANLLVRALKTKLPGQVVVE